MATRSLTVRPLNAKEHETYKRFVKAIPGDAVDGHPPDEVLRHLIQKFGGNIAHIEEQINAWFDGKLTLKEEAWTTHSSRKHEPTRRHPAGPRGERGSDRNRQRPAKGAAPKGKGAERPRRQKGTDSEKQVTEKDLEEKLAAAANEPKKNTWASHIRKALEVQAVAPPSVAEDEVPEESVVEAVDVKPEEQPEKPEQEASEPIVSDPRVVKGVWGNKAGLTNVKSSKSVVKPQPVVETPDEATEPEKEDVDDEEQSKEDVKPETQEPVEEPKAEVKSEVTEPVSVEPAVTSKRGIHFGLSLKEESKGKFKFGAVAATERTKTKHLTGSELDKYILDSMKNTSEDEPEAPVAKSAKPKREPRQKEKKETVSDTTTAAAAPVTSDETPKEADKTQKAENTPVVPTPPPAPPANAFNPNSYQQFGQLPSWMMNNPMFLSFMYQAYTQSQMMPPNMAPGSTFPNAPTLPADFQTFVQNAQVNSDGPGTSTHGMADIPNNPGFNNMASNFNQTGFNTMPGHMSSMPYNNFAQPEANATKGNNFPQGTQQQNRQWNSNQSAFPSGNAPYSFNTNVGGQGQHSAQSGQFGSGNFPQFPYGFDKSYFDKNNQGPNAQAPGLKQNNAAQGTYSYASVSSYNASGANQSPNFNNTQSETSGHMNPVTAFNYPNTYSNPSGQTYFRQN